MSPPDVPKRLADDMIVSASIIAFYLFGSDKRRFQRRVYYLTHTVKCRLPSFRLSSQIAVHKSLLCPRDRRSGGQPMTRRHATRHRRQPPHDPRNVLKDVFEELGDINSGANDLIVRRTPDAVVATNRLKVALEHDLHTLVSVEQDPRFILEQVDGDDRFAYDRTQPEPDAFANWHEIR